MRKQEKSQAAATALMVAIAIACNFSQPIAALCLITFPLTAGFFLLSWYPKLLDKVLGR